LINALEGLPRGNPDFGRSHATGVDTGLIEALFLEDEFLRTNQEGAQQFWSQILGSRYLLIACKVETEGGALNPQSGKKMKPKSLGRVLAVCSFSCAAGANRVRPSLRQWRNSGLSLIPAARLCPGRLWLRPTWYWYATTRLTNDAGAVCNQTLPPGEYKVVVFDRISHSDPGKVVMTRSACE
jgi:hypothetical protein